MDLSVCQFGTYPPPLTGISVHIKSVSDRLEKLGARVRIINTTTRPSGGLAVRSLRTALHYAKALTGAMVSREDLVHIHASAGLTFWSRLPLLVALRLRRKPSVLTIHSGSFPEWASAQRLTRPLLRFALGLPARVIALNEAQRDTYHALGCTPERVSLIIPFIGAEKAGALPERVEEFRASHEPLLCVSGGWRRLYGIEGFISAFAELRKAPGMSNAGAVALMSFSSHDDPGYCEEIERQVESAGLTPHILFLPSGQTPHEQAMALMQVSDVFVRSSLHDGDAVSVREALLIGTVTVASDTGLRPEGCLLYPPGDGAALAEVLQQVCASDRQPVATTPSRAVEDGFDQLLRVYVEVTGRD